jgi:hypothetical protein
MPNKPKICKPSPPPLQVTTGYIAWARLNSYQFPFGTFIFDILVLDADKPYGTELQVFVTPASANVGFRDEITVSNGLPGGAKLQIDFWECGQQWSGSIGSKFQDEPPKLTEYTFFTFASPP